MPAQPSWLLRVPEILALVRGSPSAFFDRESLETLFKLRRRQAIDLLHRIGGYQAGKALIVERGRLEAWLHAAALGPEFRLERKRHARVAESIENARRLREARKQRFRIGPDAREKRLEGLPATIHLKPGELRIEFFGAEDLFRQLYELGQVIANDYTRFRVIAEGSGE